MRAEEERHGAEYGLVERLFGEGGRVFEQAVGEPQLVADDSVCYVHRNSPLMRSRHGDAAGWLEMYAIWRRKQDRPVRTGGFPTTVGPIYPEVRGGDTERGLEGSGEAFHGAISRIQGDPRDGIAISSQLPGRTLEQQPSSESPGRFMQRGRDESIEVVPARPPRGDALAIDVLVEAGHDEVDKLPQTVAA